jgi:NAD(P)-dependent dehydrogenase (short-subunit alcohol dehydrogenase family)
MSVQPSIVVITGVTRGLGRAMVDEFVRLGHKVVGCARTTHQIEKLARTYPEHDFQPVDVASDAQVKAWTRRLLAKFGPPDLLLNNAAVINSKAALWRVSNRDFADEVDINIKGLVNMVRYFVPSMIKRKRGIIVNFTSRWGKKFETNIAPYCATKWAVVALTRVLAEELQPEGVAAIGLNPGIVKTGMLQRYMGDSSVVDMSKFLSPADWAKIAVPFILQLRLKDTGHVCNVLTPSRLHSLRES